MFAGVGYIDEDSSWIVWKSTVVEDGELIRAYLAGLLDGSSSLGVRVGKSDDHALGYFIQPRLRLARRTEDGPRILHFWCEEVGVDSTLNQDGDRWVWKVSRREDVERVLEVLSPYFLIHDDAVAILLNEIIPRLERAEHTSKEGFLETMEYVDMVRQAVPKRGGSKYDRAYFEDLWS